MKSFFLAISAASAAIIFGCTSSGDNAAKVEEVVTPKEAQTASLEKPVTQPAGGPHAEVTKKDDELYLQQARIMSRMSEIENELKQQREKIRLLEQGLLTGIAPDDLKRPHNDGSAKKAAHRAQINEKFENPLLPRPNLDGIDLKTNAVTDGTVKEQVQDSEQKMAGISSRFKVVQDLYQASRFGVAISELASLSRELGENGADGQVRLWLGKSYARLKDFTTARVEFEAYLKGWPSSPQVAEVRLELAQIYAGLGLKERARGELRRVMKDFSGQEPSEIAAVEFSKLQGGL